MIGSFQTYRAGSRPRPRVAGGSRGCCGRGTGDIVRLEQEVEVVRAREEALKGVIERMVERYGAWIAYERRAEQ
jgi:hypothetical protein